MKTLLLASIGLVTAFNTPEPQGSFHVADIRKSFFVREQGVEKPSVSDFPDNTFEEIDPGLIMPPSPFKQKEEIASLQSQTVSIDLDRTDADPIALLLSLKS